MALQALGFIELPAHVGEGGFDHAAVHEATGHVYVAHTANDALDVLDVEQRWYLGSIDGLTAVAGALVAEPDTVFTSNRGENTVGIMRVGQSGPVEKVAMGLRPNGLAYDGGRNRLLAAHVGDPDVPGSRTVSIVDVGTRTRVADLPVAGRTRWTVYDPVADVFHVNIADPPQIVAVRAGDPPRVERSPPCPRRVRTVWTSISSAGGSSARVTPRCSLRWMPTAARCSAGRRSPGFRTWCSSIESSSDSTSRSEIRV